MEQVCMHTKVEEISGWNKHLQCLDGCNQVFSSETSWDYARQRASRTAYRRANARS